RPVLSAHAFGSCLGLLSFASTERGRVEGRSSLYLSLCLRRPPGSGSSHFLGSRVRPLAVRRGRSDRISCATGSEKIRPRNPHERATGGRHRAEFDGGGGLLPGHGSFRPLGPDCL